MLKPSSTYPNREQVVHVLLELIAGNITREAASNWAWPWISVDDPEVADEAIWNAIDCLAMADSPTIDRPYLLDEEDFFNSLHDLENSL